MELHEQIVRALGRCGFAVTLTALAAQHVRRRPGITAREHRAELLTALNRLIAAGRVARTPSGAFGYRYRLARTDDAPAEAPTSDPFALAVIAALRSLGPGPHPVEEIAAAAGLSPDAALRLLRRAEDYPTPTGPLLVPGGWAWVD